MLMITHSCNLNCTYCYEAFKSNKMMSFELACSLILKECEFVKRHRRKFKGLEIDLMGGEPMTNFPLIKQLVEWAEAGNIDVPYIFFITTNGTLFDDERKRWFREHSETIICGVSYDGDDSLQKQNRGSTSRAIDIDFFLETYPNQGVHMTVSKETLPFMARGILALQHKGVVVEAALAEGIEWTVSDAEIYREQLKILSDAYLADPALKPIHLLTRLISVENPSKNRKRQRKFCGTGDYMITYDVDGKAYGCHMFTPIVLGENALEIGNIDWKCPTIAEDAVCKKCVLKNYCPTCAGFNFRYRGNIAERDKRRCRMYLEEARVATEFQLALVATRRSSLDENDAQHAQAALRAYEVLSQVDMTRSCPPFSLNTK